MENEKAEEDEEEYFYLWEGLEKLLEIYKICKNYLSEFYGLPENILLALVKEEGLPLKESLEKIPFIHSGFISVISPTEKESNG